MLFLAQHLILLKWKNVPARLLEDGLKIFYIAVNRDKKRFSIILFFKPFKLRHGDISMNLNYLTDLPDSSCSCSGFVFLVGWDDLGTTGRDVGFGFSGSEKKRKKLTG